MASAAPMAGNTGENGTRKPRSRSGRVRRSTITPMLVITNANSVPMFTSLAISDSGTNAANAANRMPNVAVMRTGVRRRSEIFAKPRGSRPSRHIANMIRVWP